MLCAVLSGQMRAKKGCTVRRPHYTRQDCTSRTAPSSPYSYSSASPVQTPLPPYAPPTPSPVPCRTDPTAYLTQHPGTDCYGVSATSPAMPAVLRAVVSYGQARTVSERTRSVPLLAYAAPTRSPVLP
eukprot:2662178-Rhodomonas_salina.2